MKTKNLLDALLLEVISYVLQKPSEKEKENNRWQKMAIWTMPWRAARRAAALQSAYWLLHLQDSTPARQLPRAEDNVREPLDHVHGLARVGHIRLVAQRLCW